MSGARRSEIASGLLLCAAIACGDTQSGGNSGGSASSATGSNPSTAGETTGTGGTTSSPWCPSIEPATGSACTEEGRACWFENCGAPDYRDGHELICVEGAWTLSLERLCVNPERCPASNTFTVGQTCDAAATPGPCRGLDACSSTNLASCVDGVWVLTSSLDEDADIAEFFLPATGGAGTVGTATTGFVPPPPECPLDPPELGASCCPDRVPEVCAFDAATGGAGGAGGASGAGGTQAMPATGGCLACNRATMLWEASTACL